MASEDLGGDEGGETMTRIYYVAKKILKRQDKGKHKAKKKKRLRKV